MIPKRRLSQDKVSLEIDLKKLFGVVIPDGAVRRQIAEDLIQKILDRTESGRGVNKSGREVKLKSPYSKEYIDSPEFKAFGKKKSKVDMKLTGSMLSSIDMLSEDKQTIEIGIDNEEAPKAYNHMIGDTVPERPFLGLTEKDLNEVRDKYTDDVIGPVTAADIFEQKNLARIINIVSGKKIGFSP